MNKLALSILITTLVLQLSACTDKEKTEDKPTEASLISTPHASTETAAKISTDITPAPEAPNLPIVAERTVTTATEEAKEDQNKDTAKTEPPSANEEAEEEKEPECE